MRLLLNVLLHKYNTRGKLKCSRDAAHLPHLSLPVYTFFLSDQDSKECQCLASVSLIHFTTMAWCNAQFYSAAVKLAKNNSNLLSTLDAHGSHKLELRMWNRCILYIWLCPVFSKPAQRVMTSAGCNLCGWLPDKQMLLLFLKTNTPTAFWGPQSKPICYHDV